MTEVNWSITKLKNRELASPLDANSKLHPVAEALVQASRLAGYQSITAHNWAAVADRLVLLQRVAGPLVDLPGGVGKAYITHRDVASFVGLVTDSKATTKGVFGLAMLELAARDRRKTSNYNFASALDLCKKAQKVNPVS
jgi:hypothetical protein